MTPAGTGSRAVGRAMLALFTAAIATGAFLLFVVQPMVGKMILPLGGGSPQVWVTALVFFQAALLAGYAYAHLSIRLLGARRQMLLHAVVLLLPLLALPVSLPELAVPEGGARSTWVLALLTLSVGAPVVVLAAASPVLQSWLATTRHPDADDPYFLYAGSNAGSLLGLLAYPFLAEPLLGLTSQSRLWAAGYGLFVLLALGCAWMALRSGKGAADASLAAEGAEAVDSRGRSAADEEVEAPAPPVGAAPPEGSEEEAAPQDGVEGGRPRGTPDARDRLFWLAAAAVPSALLVGVTHFLTSRMVPVPLLWVLPLAVYLVTFIVAFARRRFVPVAATSRAVAVLAAVTAPVLLLRINSPAWALVALHLAVLGAAALLCHQRLAARRPATSHLTEFYLLVSLGGVLGGAFSALVAPLAFDTIAEYPVALVLATLFMLPRSSGRFRAADVALPAALALWLFGGEALLGELEAIPDGVVMVALALAPTVVVYLFSPRPVRFALALAALLAFESTGRMYRGEVLFQERTFFGVYRVAQDPDADYRILYHGATIHGMRSLEAGRQDEPLAYYHPTGPAGQVVSAVRSDPESREIALVGAGTGALAALAGPHQRVTLYEIDPLVREIAANPEWFTYVERSPAEVRWVVGDGRLALARSETSYDLIVLDAFTSGSIPMHLLTREAMDLYLDRLQPGGILLFHISNNHLDLAPVLADHAAALGLQAFLGADLRDGTEAGILGSEWVVLTRDPASLARVPSRGWMPLQRPPGAPTWTDDHSNLLGVQKWF